MTLDEYSLAYSTDGPAVKCSYRTLPSMSQSGPATKLKLKSIITACVPIQRKVIVEHLPKRHFGSDPQIPLSENANIEDIKLTSSSVDQEDLQTKSRPDIINEQLMRWFVISHRAPSRYANTSHHLKQAMSSCEIVRSNDETVMGPGEVTSESTTKNELVSQCDDVHGVKLTRHKVVPVDSHALIMPWKRAIRRCPGSS